MPRGKIEILFIVIHHDNVSLTLDCIASITENVDRNARVKIAIVDNSENPAQEREIRSGSKKWEECHSVQFELISCRNIGYFPSVNLALVHLGNVSEPDYCVVCNNDIVFDGSFCATLSSAQYPNSAMVVYPDLVSSGGKHENPREMSYVSAPRLMAYRLYFSSHMVAQIMRRTHQFATRFLSIARRKRGVHRLTESERPIEITLGVGACFILSQAYFRRKDSLPGDVFLFGEEALLTNNVLEIGGKVYFDGRLRVVHEEHSTVGSMPTRAYWRIQRQSSRKFIPALWQIRRRLKRQENAQDVIQRK